MASVYVKTIDIATNIVTKEESTFFVGNLDTCKNVLNSIFFAGAGAGLDIQYFAKGNSLRIFYKVDTKGNGNIVEYGVNIRPLKF